MRDFDKLWAGQAISALGSHFTGTGLPLTAILVLGAGPVEMGVLAAASGLGVLLVAPVAGVWVDRLRRGPIMIGADLGRAAILLSIPVLALAGALRIEHVYLVAFGAALLGTFFDVAYRSFLPALVGREELAAANGRLAMSANVAEVGGPGLAGALVQALTAPVALVIDAASFVVSAVSVALIRSREPGSHDAVDRGSVLAEIGEGARVAIRLPVLRALLGAGLVFSFFGSMVGALYGLYGIRELGLSPFAVGALVSLGGLSAIPGSLVAGSVARRFGLGRATGGSLFCYGCVGLLIPLASGPTLVAFGFLAAQQLLGDWLVSIHLVGEVSLRQLVAPAALLGRVNATAHFLVLGVGPLGAILAGRLALDLGIRAALLVGVCGVIAAGAWLLLSPTREVR